MIYKDGAYESENAIKKEIARVDFTQSVFAYLYPLSNKHAKRQTSYKLMLSDVLKKITLTPRASLDI